MNTAQNKVKVGIALFWCMIVSILIVNNWDIPYWDQDEAAYAGFGRNMLEGGQWLIPDYMYADVHRKPPLHFWSIAWSYRIFGYNEFAVRFPAVLSILGTLLIVYTQIKKFFDVKLAMSSVWIMATSFLVMALAKVSVTDATVLFSMTLCAFSLINVLLRFHWKWVLYFWLGIIIGTLTKGPPVILFSGAFGLFLLIFMPQRKNLIKLHPWFFGIVALLPLYIWGYMAYQQDGGTFIRWMIDWYILKRVDGQVFGQTGPPGTHLVLLMGFFLFYIGYFIPAWWHTIKAAWALDSWSKILVGYLVAGWFFFEFTPSKLPAYAIGAHVPIGIMIAIQMNHRMTHQSWLWIQHSLRLIIGVLGLILLFLYKNELPLWHEYLPFIGTLWVVVSLILFYYFIKEKNKQGFQYNVKQYIWNSLTIIVIWLLLPPVTQALSASYQIKDRLQKIKRKAKSVYVCTNPGDQPSLPVYIQSIGMTPINLVHQSMDSILQVMKNDTTSVFLLNQEQYDRANIYYDMNTGIVSTPIIDRKGVNEYFIIYNLESIDRPTDSYDDK